MGIAARTFGKSSIARPDNTHHLAGLKMGCIQDCLDATVCKPVGCGLPHSLALESLGQEVTHAQGGFLVRALQQGEIKTIPVDNLQAAQADLPRAHCYASTASVEPGNSNCCENVCGVRLHQSTPVMQYEPIQAKPPGPSLCPTACALHDLAPAEQARPTLAALRE